MNDLTVNFKRVNAEWDITYKRIYSEVKGERGRTALAHLDAISSVLFLDICDSGLADMLYGMLEFMKLEKYHYTEDLNNALRVLIDNLWWSNK